MSFVDAYETVCNLKHVVPQGDDNELGILGLFLKTDRQGKKKIQIASLEFSGTIQLH